MRSIFLLFLIGCAYTDRPADLIKPGSIYCEPVNDDFQRCRDGNDWPWTCAFKNGRWTCEAYHKPAPSAYVPPLFFGGAR